MFNYEHSSDFKVRSAPRFEKPNIPFPRNSVNFLRRPFPLLRRRMMSGRYPNMDFRPLRHPVFRPDCPPHHGMSPNFRYHTSPSSVLGMPPCTGERPLFPGATSNYPLENKSHQFPPRPTALNYTDSQTGVDLEHNVQFSGPNTFSDIWVEALAPNGRKYYYNARTRITAWDRPINVRIIDLDEIKRLQSYPGVEYPQHSPKENQNPFLHQQPRNSYCSSFFPSSIPMSPRFVMFPPPQNICNPSQIFPVSPSEHVQDNPSYKLGTMVPPPMFSLPAVSDTILTNNKPTDSDNMLANNESFDSHNMLTNNEANDKANVPSSEIINDSAQTILQTYTDNENFSSKENKISDWSVSDSKISLYTSDVNEENISEKEEIITLQEDKIDETDKCKSENCIQSSKLESTAETKRLSGEEPFESKNEEQEIDKSRPVSSTNVSGTCWFVVWTGDERVFYFDSQRKISVWERPSELINRSDVDKLVEESPLSKGLKSLRKEVRKIESDGSDTIKKLKKEKEEDEDSNLIENSESKENITDEKTQTEKEKPKSEDIPHEQRVKIFCDMLAENNVSAFSTWEKELHKIVFDPRYLLLPSKERKQIFETHISKKIEEEKNDRQKELLHQKEKFFSLLVEANVTSKSRFNDFAQRYGKDVRFKAIEKIKQKENMFYEYTSELIKKEKELEKLKAEKKRNFIELLGEQKFTSKELTWSEVQENISKDERYKAIQSNSLKEKIFKEYIRGLYSIPKEREDRISVSIRNREEEVKRDLSGHLRDREREQELHKKKNAISDFKALLNDLIRNSDISWHSAKKILKEDHRWSYMLCLESEKREELFSEHINLLNSKKREQFHRLLDEIPNITLKTSWLDIRKTVLNDPRCAKFTSSERKCEKEFKEYLLQKFLSAKADFKELLKETKIITYKSKSLLNDTNHWRDIVEILSQDKRYLNLDCMSSERKEIILSYIDKLHVNGPPPPPTATDPSNRTKLYK